MSHTPPASTPAWTTQSHSEFVKNLCLFRGFWRFADAKGVLVRLHSTQGVFNSLQCNPSMANSDKCLTLTLTTTTLTLTLNTITLTINAPVGALSLGVKYRSGGMTNPLRRTKTHKDPLHPLRQQLMPKAPGVDFWRTRSENVLACEINTLKLIPNIR